MIDIATLELQLGFEINLWLSAIDPILWFLQGFTFDMNLNSEWTTRINCDDCDSWDGNNNGCVERITNASNSHYLREFSWTESDRICQTNALFAV